MPSTRARPVVGVLCCNEVHDRTVQVVASRFVVPLARISDATVLLVPVAGGADDSTHVAALLDGLLLTGSRSHVAPERYGAAAAQSSCGLDPKRDETALALAGRMIEASKPVFGICRGLQELNVLFGGTLSSERCCGRHHGGQADYPSLFDHRHGVELVAGGRLATATGQHRLNVNSVHEQAVDRLGTGLTVEAVADGDAVVEAIAARPCGAEVLAVQWHPEWDVVTSAASRAFFALIGASIREARG